MHHFDNGVHVVYRHKCDDSAAGGAIEKSGRQSPRKMAGSEQE
jgi:hypothetical protein